MLALLQRLAEGHTAGEAELEEVLAANAFFVDFYSQWEGCDREAIKQAIRHFAQPERVPPGMLPTGLAEGFRQAVAETPLLQSRLSWLGEVDTSAVAERVLAFLPPSTPLDSVIHITVDSFNHAFVYRREMGVSVLKGMEDRRTFEEAVAHELHHVCVHYWSDQDDARRTLLQGQTGRAVAVQHVQNLLFEGMANYYLTPGYVFRASPGEPPADPYQARLDGLRREEGKLFAQAEAVLAASLEPGADHAQCLSAFRALALDMEYAMLPSAHYLGARMIQTIEQVHSRSRVVECVCHLPEFLPLYDEAARKTGGFVFSTQLVERFAQLWEPDGRGQ
jgi:hypothetical protein